ncbi:PaaI family thioesterase [Rhizobium sp. L1K21]|uniref:PaaI family thioesterase n=1 Tax=Rhizobium sp. L1K21 TaxID=2954933 RepID=UPI002092CD0B|nr:PaaI family thioesterase [Rhizobium sp. L1K21]MCO6185857.1 PaaI family thioesterase [Rhizobium sp. L1K21]
MKPILTAEMINSFLSREFPQIRTDEIPTFEVMNVSPGTTTVRFMPDKSHLRPGGTINGPAVFAVADVTAYVTLLAHIGPVVGAVTANLNINFLHRPEPVPIEGIGKILKIGKQLSVIDVLIERTDTRQIIASATATFSAPLETNEKAGNTAPAL